LGEENTITTAEDFIALKPLKKEEPAGCVEIGSELFKVLNIGVQLLPRVSLEAAISATRGKRPNRQE